MVILGGIMKYIFIFLFGILTISTVQAEHIRSDGYGGYYDANGGHIRSDGNGGYYDTNGGHIRSDGFGGFYTPD
jgi:hypothetical protein